MISLKNNFRQLLLAVFTGIFFLSCQKDLSNTDGQNPAQTPDLTTKVNSSVSGFVTDENNAPVLGASVYVGSTFTTTDKYGFFEVKNVQVVKNAAVVTVTQPGYFKGIKTYMAVENKAAFFRIKLIPKTTVGTINATADGNVTLGNGLSVALPANSVITVSSGTAYTGTVNIAAHWIDPTATDLNETMPGDLRGIATDGSLKLLTTYGMAAVELTGSAGELLQIATGKKATLTLNIPSSLQASAPSTIQLSSFNETNGLWKEEGTATKTGSAYVSEVSHFSFWNIYLPGNYVQFDCTITDPAGNPIPYVDVQVTDLVTGVKGYGFTDLSGYVSGAVPANAQLSLKVFNSYTCNSLYNYSQNFTTSNVDISLGVIAIIYNPGIPVISGTVTDCNNNPVTDGYVIVKLNNWVYYKYPFSNGTGTFNFSMWICNLPVDITLIPEDKVNNQQGVPVNVTIVQGANNVGNLQACGLSTQQYLSYTVNGGAPISLAPPTHSFGHSVNFNNANIAGYSSIGTGNDMVYLYYDNQGIAVGSVQNMTRFYANTITDSTIISTPIGINITEYGAIGEYISGNFSGTLTNWQPPNNTYNVSCNFRVKRQY